MANWKFRLDLKDVWEKLDSEEIPISEGGLIIEAKINDLISKINPNNNEEIEEEFALDELFDIATNMASVVDVEDFDCQMGRLYDWGDTKLSNRKWPEDRMCWIATSF